MDEHIKCTIYDHSTCSHPDPYICSHCGFEAHEKDRRARMIHHGMMETADDGGWRLSLKRRKPDGG